MLGYEIVCSSGVENERTKVRRRSHFGVERVAFRSQDDHGGGKSVTAQVSLEFAAAG
jgi:hypothetical protein